MSKIYQDQNTVVICNSKNHERIMTELHKTVSKKFKKICMVTIHKPFPTLIKKFQEEKIDYSNYCFIDCISAENRMDDAIDQCIYISSPVALTELAVAIEKMIDRFGTDLIILDNISSLLIYNQESAVLRFLHHVMTRVRKTDMKAIYSILQEGRKGFMEEMTLFADTMIEH